MFRKLFISLVGFVLCSTWAFAQTEPAVSTEPSAQEVVAPVEDQVDVSINQAGNVSLDFRDADIRNVLKILSFKSGVNIVAGPEVIGVVTIQLNDVPWEVALDVILSTNGYAHERKGNILVVTTIENLKKRREDAMLLADQEPVETRTQTLNFGKAADLAESIEKMKSDRGHVDVDARTNTMIMTDIASRLDLMSQVIKDLDTTTPQVLIEAKIVETQFSDQENLGVDWLVQASISGAGRPIIYPFDNETDNRFGPDAFPAADDDLFKFGTLDFSQVSAVFEALKTRSDTNILSAPRIVTLDNLTAKITIGTQYPFPEYTYNEEQARLQVSGWEYKDIGVIFEVTPHVNRANFVTLEIKPEITAILDLVTVENTELPRLSNESAITNVMVKDGDTLVIAGLVTDQVTDTKKKVPILGDIPILGYVFQKSEEKLEKKDLVIFMTPHVITPELEEEDMEAES